MNIYEALTQAKQGDKIRREAWEPNSCLVVGTHFIRNAFREPTPVERIESLRATDWEVIHVPTPEEVAALREAMLEAAQAHCESNLGSTWSAWDKAHAAYLAAKEAQS